MVTICLRRRLPGASSDRYPRTGRAAVDVLLFGLAPGGVYLAGRSPGRRWALTPPFHPYLTAPLRRSTLSGGSFLWHFPSGRPDWVLPSALLCGARTFLQRYLLRRRSPVRLGPVGFYPRMFESMRCVRAARNRPLVAWNRPWMRWPTNPLAFRSMWTVTTLPPPSRGLTSMRQVPPVCAAFDS